MHTYSAIRSILSLSLCHRHNYNYPAMVRFHTKIVCGKKRIKVCEAKYSLVLVLKTLFIYQCYSQSRHWHLEHWRQLTSPSSEMMETPNRNSHCGRKEKHFLCTRRLSHSCSNNLQHTWFAALLPPRFYVNSYLLPLSSEGHCSLSKQQYTIEHRNIVHAESL